MPLSTTDRSIPTTIKQKDCLAYTRYNLILVKDYQIIFLPWQRNILITSDLYVTAILKKMYMNKQKWYKTEAAMRYSSDMYGHHTCLVIPVCND